MKPGGSCQVRKTGKTRETSLATTKEKEKNSRCIETTGMCFCVILMSHSHD